MKKAIAAMLHNVSLEQLKDIECLYCMDSKLCNQCKGEGKFLSKHGGWKLCGYCKGTRRCPMCAHEPESD